MGTEDQGKPSAPPAVVPTNGGAPPDAHDEAEDDRRANRSLKVLVVVLVLAGLGWLLVDRISRNSRLQDCVQSGKRNCALIEEGGR